MSEIPHGRKFGNTFHLSWNFFWQRWDSAIMCHTNVHKNGPLPHAYSRCRRGTWHGGGSRRDASGRPAAGTPDERGQGSAQRMMGKWGRPSNRTQEKNRTKKQQNEPSKEIAFCMDFVLSESFADHCVLTWILCILQHQPWGFRMRNELSIRSKPPSLLQCFVEVVKNAKKYSSSGEKKETKSVRLCHYTNVCARTEKKKIEQLLTWSGYLCPWGPQVRFPFPRLNKLSRLNEQRNFK